MNIEDVVELDIPISSAEMAAVRHKWHRYHPGKDIERYACSITSLDGTADAGVNYEALYQYNREHNTSFNEMMFDQPTVHAAPYNYLLKNFQVGRSHYLRLPRSGYFPWHRDADPSSIRIIHTIDNCTPHKLVWILDDKVLQLKNNSWYYINTTKKHCLFSFDESLFAVFNLANTKDNMLTLYNHMTIK